MKTDYDVIIIGAGPAGASCAKHLVENGVKTLVVEKKKLPRYKCCGGMISNRAKKFIENTFGDLPENLFCKDKKIKLRFSFKGKYFFTISFINLWSIKRDQFDYWLIKQSNTKIDTSLYLKHIENNNKIEVYLLKDGKRLFIQLDI